MAAKKLSSVVLVCVLLFIFVTGNPICPDQAVIAPCTCKVVAYGLDVVCVKIESVEKLQEKFKILSTYHVDNLLLHGLNFSKPISNGLFQGMNIKALQIEKSRMEIDGPAFTGLDDSLQRLNVMDCSLAKHNFELARLSKLSDIQFRSNRFEKITNKWLKDTIPNVQQMSLDNNDIATVEEGAFAYLNKLKEISLADNRISTVSRNMFPMPADKLLRIDLSHNELRTLPTDIFTKMPNLLTVVLSGNDLRSIPEATWSDIWSQMNAVLLYENSIICDDRVQWIKNSRKPKQLEGTCAEPMDLKGKPLKKVLHK